MHVREVLSLNVFTAFCASSPSCAYTFLICLYLQLDLKGFLELGGKRVCGGGVGALTRATL